MPTQAQVTSLDALETFRAQLVVYLEKARAAADDVMSDVSRTRAWLQTDQRAALEGQVRRRMKALELAQQELFSSRVSQLDDQPAVKVMAVTRAKRSLAEAQAKLTVLKQWARRYDNETAPLAKPVDKFRSFLVTDLQAAVFSLEQTLRTLDDYTGRGGFSSTSQPASATGAPEAKP